MLPRQKRVKGQGHRVTLKFIAEYLGLSPTTISVVLSNSPHASTIAHPTKVRIWEAVEKFQYRPNLFARYLQSKRSYSIAVLVPEIGDEFSSMLISGIESNLGEAKFNYFVESHRFAPAQIENSPDTLMEEILRDADTAMYRAKSLGKARYETFDADMRASVMARLQLEMDLHRAIKHGEFSNFYQPIVSLSSGEIVGFEALLRWQHPTRGQLPPKEFIPVAEETGLIRELGWWNLREACRQISEWRTSYPSSANLTMSVNLSPKQFVEDNLVQDIKALLLELDLPARALKLELTESTVMGNPQATIEMLEQMKEIGISLAIDDFGTGYSSLSYLHRFPLDTLKIDRSFISGIVGAKDDSESAEIARTILPMASNLHLEVVAEGIETSEQFAMLKALRCKYGQGFYFSKPLPAAEAASLLTKQPNWEPKHFSAASGKG
jgi:EAL domain-containing protein (putative c-di-GMP-specific phosphodiesterase class I)